MDRQSGTVATQRAWVRWDALVIAVALAAAVVRAVVLGSGSGPATIDAGNWLAFADTFFGASYRSSDLLYPPVVPILTDLFTRIAGLSVGIALLGALAAVAPGLATYYVVRRSYGPSIWACGVSAAALFAGSTGEATAWGGFPQLLGFALMLLLIEELAHGALARPWRGGTLLFLVAATSHFVLLLTIFAAALVAALIWVTDERASSGGGGASVFRVWAKAVGIAAVPGLVLLPTYISLTSNVTSSRGPRQGEEPTGLSNAWATWDFITREATFSWLVVLVVGCLAPWMALERRRSAAWRVGVALSVTPLICTLLVGETRYTYALPLAFLVSLVAIFNRPSGRRQGQDGGVRRWTRRSALLLAAVVMASISVGGVRSFQDQRAFYGVMNDDLVEILGQVGRSYEPSEAVIAVPSKGSAPLGWWTEALTQRPTLYAAPLRWLVYDDEIRRAVTANAIFQPGFPSTEGLGLAVEAGIDVIVVPAGWTFDNPEANLRFREQWPESVVGSNDGGYVIDMAIWLAVAEGASPP